MKFKLTIECDNDAFRDPAVEDERVEFHTRAIVDEVARILNSAANSVRWSMSTDRKLFDANGNKVGEYEFTN